MCSQRIETQRMTVKTLKKIKMEIICPPKAGEIVEGQVINRAKSALFLDLGPKGIGVILGREFFESKSSLKNLKPGDKIMTKIVALETDDGFRELSLVGANQEMAWKELAIEQEKQTVFEMRFPVFSNEII